MDGYEGDQGRRERRGDRAALYISIGAAALAAAGLIAALVIGLHDSGSAHTSGTPPDRAAAHSRSAAG